VKPSTKNITKAATMPEDRKSCNMLFPCFVLAFAISEEDS